jgi:hypothetical protein
MEQMRVMGRMIPMRRMRPMGRMRMIQIQMRPMGRMEQKELLTTRSVNSATSLPHTSWQVRETVNIVTQAITTLST